MARLIVLAAALFPAAALLTTPALHAANSEFEGVWRMDLERSDSMMRGTKVDNSYTLAARGEDVEVKRTFYRHGQSNAIDWVFVTDGKPHEVPGLRAPRKVRVKWQKEKLSVSYSMSFDTSRDAVSVDVVFRERARSLRSGPPMILIKPEEAAGADVTETWLINKAGELEIRYVTRTARGPQSRVEVYIREAAS